MSDQFLKSLGEYYTENVLRGKSPSVAAQSLKELLKTDKEARYRAQERLAQLNQIAAKCHGNLAKRCYVSSVQKTALEEALRD